MAERGRKLTKASITNLRRTMSDVEQLKARIRLGSERSSETRRAAAHYIVETPSGGIPAATGSPPNPGSAECTIFWRNGDPKEVSTTNRTVTVYNYTSTLIPGTTLVMVHRDGWGDLWAVPSDSSCASLEDLEPGTYRAICGATIAPGETGGVIVTNCNGETVAIDAVNQTNCTFYVGERISVHVTPCCTAHFSGCNCCTEPTICQSSIVVCICGELQVLAVNGGTYTWDVSGCCNCEGATLEVTLSCSTGPDLIEADWVYTCSGSTQSGTITLTSLFNLSADVEIIDQLADLCDGYLLDRWANFAEPCATVTDPCCFCATYESAGVDKIGGISGSSIAVDLAMNRTTWCNGDSVTYTLTCTNNAGVSLDIRPIINFGALAAAGISGSSCGRYSIDSSTPAHASNTAVPVAGACEADNPALVTWADVSVAAGATIERSVTVTWADVANADGDGGSVPAKITAYCGILSGSGNYRAMTRVCDVAVRCGNAVAGGGDEGAPGGGEPGGEGGGI